MIRARNPIDAFTGLNSSAVEKTMLRRPRPCGLVRLSSSSPRRKSQMGETVIFLLVVFGASRSYGFVAKLESLLNQLLVAGHQLCRLTIEFDRKLRIYCHPFSDTAARPIIIIEKQASVLNLLTLRLLTLS